MDNFQEACPSVLHGMRQGNLRLVLEEDVGAVQVSREVLHNGGKLTERDCAHLPF